MLIIIIHHYMLSNIQHWNQEGRFLRDHSFYREAQGAMRVGAICLCPHCQIGYQSDQLPFLGSCISESKLLHPETHNWCFCIRIPTDQIYCKCPQPSVTFSLMSFWGVKNKKHQNSYSWGTDLRQANKAYR